MIPFSGVKTPPPEMLKMPSPLDRSKDKTYPLSVLPYSEVE